MPPIPAETTDPATIAWARHLLGLTAEDLNDPDRGPMLRRLATVEFRTPTKVVEAALTLSGNAPRAMARRADFEGLLRERINRFAEQFFKLSPEKRSKEYHTLAPVDAAAAAAYPAHAERLRRLEPLLDLSPARSMKSLDEPARELARHLVRLATLAPAEQAVLRRRLVSNMLDDAPRWQTAAETIARQAPKLIQLDRSLVDQARFLTKRNALVGSAKKRAAGFVRSANMATTAARERRNRSLRQSLNYWSSVIANSMILFGGIVFAAIIIGVVIRDSLKDKSKSRAQAPPASNITQEDIRYFDEFLRQHERRRQIKAGGSANDATGPSDNPAPPPIEAPKPDGTTERQAQGLNRFVSVYAGDGEEETDAADPG